MQDSLHQLATKFGNIEGEIVGFSGDQKICERLHEMGLYQGLSLRVIGRAPWGGPWLVQFHTTSLALRAEEAECPILVMKSKNQ